MSKKSRMNRIKAFERDNLLVNIIMAHKGKENAIGTQEIVLELDKNGYKLPADQLHQIIKKITVERCLPICSLTNCGYWWATSKRDIQTAIDGLQSKIDGLQKRIDLLKSFICE